MKVKIAKTKSKPCSVLEVKNKNKLKPCCYFAAAWNQEGTCGYEVHAREEDDDAAAAALAPTWSAQIEALLAELIFKVSVKFFTS